MAKYAIHYGNALWYAATKYLVGYGKLCGTLWQRVRYVMTEYLVRCSNSRYFMAECMELFFQSSLAVERFRSSYAHACLCNTMVLRSSSDQRTI